MASSQFRPGSVAPVYDHIAVEDRDGVAQVRLNRPDRLNTLGIGAGSSRDEIAAAMEAADRDHSVGCILLTAAGPAFCAGGDLTGVAPAQTPFEEFAFIRALAGFYDRLRAVSKPIVAGVHGRCLGAGLGLVAQCDLVVAAEDARFGLIEGRVGHPGATEILPVIGAAWTKFLILTGELIDARRAESIGLVLATVPADDLRPRVFDLARRIAAVPRESAILNKASIEAMRDSMGRHAARQVGRAYDVTTKGAARFTAAPDGRRAQAWKRADESFAHAARAAGDDHPAPVQPGCGHPRPCSLAAGRVCPAVLSQVVATRAAAVRGRDASIIERCRACPR